MDALLEDMIRTARDLLVSVYGDLWEADINWDGPVLKFDVPNGLQQSRVSHAKGVIAGCAAMANMTPLELLDTVRDMTPDVERELAVETAKLEGAVIDVEPDPELEQQVSLSLDTYQRRGELDQGTVEQARECLERAAYEWTPAIELIVKRYLFRLNPPPCLRSMGCLCAGHARGDAVTAPCDTTELVKFDSRRRTKVRLVPFPAMTPVHELVRVQGFNRQPKSAASKRQRIRRIKK